jgi:hypothetical protein
MRRSSGIAAVALALLWASAPGGAEMAPGGGADFTIVGGRVVFER